MGNILQIPVPNGSSALAWSSRQPGVNSLLFINQDLNNTVWLGQEPSVRAADSNSIPLAPNGTFSGDSASNWYVTGSVAGISPLVVVPNGQGYFLGITQGLGNLVIPSVQSPNFVHNVSGWQISKNGNAEFNSLTIRGTFFGTNFILNSTGAFFYSPSEAFGNLIISISGGGTGPFGETIPTGVAVYSGGQNAVLAGAQLGFDGGGFISEGGVSPFPITIGGVPLNILTPIASVLAAVEPGTASTAEPWHTGAGLNSFTLAPTGFMRFQYRLNVDNTVEVTGCIQLPGSFAGVTFFQLPSAYRPNAVVQWPYTTQQGLTITSDGTGCVQVDTSGNMTLRNNPTGIGSGNVLFVQGRFGLGTV